MIENIILVEDIYRIEPAVSLMIFSTSLGLLPLNLMGKLECKKSLAPF